MYFTEDRIAKMFKLAGASVTLINTETSKDSNETEQDWKDRIKRNWQHLELLKTYTHEDGSNIWTTEDFTDIDAAILKGKEVQA